MFAILLSDVMDPFYKNITSFPTVVFTFFLLFCLVYWIIALFGLVDLDFLHLDGADGDLGIDGDPSSHDGMGNVGLLAGLFLKLGLTGVPFPIVFSILSVLSWFICYYAVHFIFPFVPGRLLEIVFGIPVFLGSLYVGAFLTSKIIKPLRPLFTAANQEVQKTIVGKVAIVRTTKVNKDFGEATVKDGGAGLIVKVRSFKEEEFERGDRVVLLEYVQAENIYKVISETEFNNE